MIIVNCNLFEKQIFENGVNHFRLWKSNSAIALRIGKLFRKIGLFKLGNINPNLSNIDTDCIVVFDNGIVENSVLKWLEDRNPRVRLIFYYWNPVFKSISPSEIPKKFELWSYSPEDCKKYKMQYNSTFYFQSFIKPPRQPQRDVFFIGRDKGRIKDLTKIKEYITNIGLSSLFYIIATHSRPKQKKYTKYIPYSNVLEYVNESKVIVDYYVDPSSGLSLRAMESLFFQKKIITNNITYPTYNFYDSKNIFIWGKDDIAQLKNFVSAPYITVAEEKKDFFLFKEWLDRFEKENRL